MVLAENEQVQKLVTECLRIQGKWHGDELEQALVSFSKWYLYRHHRGRFLQGLSRNAIYPTFICVTNPDSLVDNLSRAKSDTPFPIFIIVMNIRVLKR